jgi:hypothetical protein
MANIGSKDAMYSKGAKIKANRSMRSKFWRLTRKEKIFFFLWLGEYGVSDRYKPMHFIPTKGGSGFQKAFDSIGFNFKFLWCISKFTALKSTKMSTFCQKSMLTYCKLKSSFRKELPQTLGSPQEYMYRYKITALHILSLGFVPSLQEANCNIVGELLIKINVP